MWIFPAQGVGLGIGTALGLVTYPGLSIFEGQKALEIGTARWEGLTRLHIGEIYISDQHSFHSSPSPAVDQ